MALGSASRSIEEREIQMTNDIGIGIILGCFLLGMFVFLIGLSPAYMMGGLGVGILGTSLLAYHHRTKSEEDD